MKGRLLLQVSLSQNIRCVLDERSVIAWFLLVTCQDKDLFQIISKFYSIGARFSSGLIYSQYFQVNLPVKSLSLPWPVQQLPNEVVLDKQHPDHSLLSSGV